MARQEGCAEYSTVLSESTHPAPAPVDTENNETSVKASTEWIEGIEIPSAEGMAQSKNSQKLTANDFVRAQFIFTNQSSPDRRPECVTAQSSPLNRKNEYFPVPALLKTVFMLHGQAFVYAQRICGY